jgi:hypothetical protein
VIVTISVAAAAFLVASLQRGPATTADGIYNTTSSRAEVTAAYSVARRRPDLLKQLPCHCGCQLSPLSHSSNLDCFKTKHGESCFICVRTAIQADRMATEGKSIEEIVRYLKNVHTFEVFEH